MPIRGSPNGGPLNPVHAFPQAIPWWTSSLGIGGRHQSVRVDVINRFCWSPSLGTPTLRMVLEKNLAAARLKPEWSKLIRELDRLQEVETEQEGKQFLLRTPVTGDFGRVFKAVGVALPPNIREVAPATAPAGK